MDEFNKKVLELKKVMVEDLKRELIMEFDSIINKIKNKNNKVDIQQFRQQMVNKSDEQKQKEFDEYYKYAKNNKIDIYECRTLNVDKINSLDDIKDLLKIIDIQIPVNNNYSDEQLKIINKLFD